MNTIQKIQRALGVKPSGIWDATTHGALNALINPSASGVHHVIASSFADPKDVAAFKACKATGKTDHECFFVGDNGIGEWGDDTTKGLWCALPPEDIETKWGSVAKGKRKPVTITANGKTVTAKLGDTMPSKPNITNGAGIDLSPDTVAALGLTPPIMEPATWQW